ncbi:LysM peptidoglycan-binding domain-containing protein [Streptomyces parvulus]
MRTLPSPTATAGRTLARLLTAVLSLLVLAAAVAGLPLLLAWATPVIWAATHGDLTHLLDRQDTGSVFLLLLVTVGWIGWCQFTFCAVRELIAQVGGRTWHAPRGLAASQRAAALLIGSILVLLPTNAALASPNHTTPATATPAPTQPQSQAPHGSETGWAGVPAASPGTSTTYTVHETRPAESLWRIAEKELGDGERWRDIADLNVGRIMTDGTVFSAHSFLQPGWQLQMPPTAEPPGGIRTQLGDAPAAGTEEEHVVTVRSGEYLSKIAEEELGDGRKWPQLFEASKGKAQPHGLPEITDPDVVYAGQQITVPRPAPEQPLPGQGQDQGEEPDSPPSTPPGETAPDGTQLPDDDTEGELVPGPSRTDGPAPEASGSGAQTSHPDRERGQEEASPSASASAAPQPSADDSASATTPPGGSSGSGSSAPATTASGTSAAARSGVPLTLRTVLGAGALLAAAITGALALRRTLQRRRRQPGEKIVIASESSPAEVQLAAAAEPDGAARLDVALRTLSHRACQEETMSVPPLRAARIGVRAVEVLPEDLSQRAQEPFVSGQDGWWVLDPDAVLLDEDAAREVPAPYPGLVTVGSTESGDLVLLNLAQLSALLLDGSPVHVSEVCTSLALELGMSPWAGEVEVVTLGFGEDLPKLLPTARIAHMRQPEHAVRDLSERLLEAHQLPDTQRQPYLLLCASSLDTGIAWELADVIDKSGTVPVTLIAPASAAGAHFPEAEILDVSLSGPQALEYAGLDITVQRLEQAAYVQIATALKMSGQPPHPAEGSWQQVPDEPDRVPAPEEPVVPSPNATSSSTVEDPHSDVFPALLAATTDPSGLHLLPPTHSRPDAGTGTGTDTASPAPASLPAPDSGGQQPGTADVHGSPAGEHQSQTEQREAHGLHSPEIRVLGAVEVTGVDSTGHGPRMAQLAALLYFRSGRSADALCSDMDPVSPWSLSTLNARMQGLRRSMGNDPAGNPYVPRRKNGESPYRLSPGVRCDWTRFLQLVEGALPLGPDGVTDLEKALALVRGRPFSGKPLPWAEPYQQEMIVRIIDVAHSVATYRTPAGPRHDLSAARQAVATGLDVDDTAELLYRDWLRIEHAAGNRQGLHTAITRLQQVNRSLDCSLETETEVLIHELLNVSDTTMCRAL